MISIDDDKVIISRDTWDRIASYSYYEDLVEILIDSEELNESIQNSDELVDFRANL